jgi:hypothetical protein
MQAGTHIDSDGQRKYIFEIVNNLKLWNELPDDTCPLFGVGRLDSIEEAGFNKHLGNKHLGSILHVSTKMAHAIVALDRKEVREGRNLELELSDT